jgi:hypothetical protein
MADIFEFKIYVVIVVNQKEVDDKQLISFDSILVRANHPDRAEMMVQDYAVQLLKAQGKSYEEAEKLIGTEYKFVAKELQSGRLIGFDNAESTIEMLEQDISI